MGQALARLAPQLPPDAADGQASAEAVVAGRGLAGTLRRRRGAPRLDRMRITQRE